MSDHHEHGAQAIVAGSFQIQQQLPNGRSMTVNGYLFQGERGDVLQAKIDAIMLVLDCTREKAEIPELEHKAHELREMIRQQEQNAEQLFAKQRDGKKLASQEQAGLTNHNSTIAELKRRLTEGLEKIEALKTKHEVA